MRPWHLAAIALGATLIADMLVAGAAASECSIAQVMVAAESVIEPCTRRLGDSAVAGTARAEAFFIRGRGYHRSKRLDQADADYQAAAEITPDNEEIWVSWSNLAIRRGDFQGYAEKVQRAFDLKPKSARVVRAVGQLYINAGQPVQALEALNEALRIDPKEPFALLFRSQQYERQRKFAEAIADADALAALPREVINHDGYLDHDGNARDFHVEALLHRARLFEAVGQQERAAADYDAAVAEGRSSPALIARANFYQSDNDKAPEAVPLLEEAARKEPHNASAFFALGLAHTYAHRFEPAFAAFDLAIGARPGFAQALKMRARMHRQFGRTEDAVKDFMAAVEANPQVVFDSMPALRHAGYWTSAKDPEAMTTDLQDAIRACMIDTMCN